MIIILLRFDGGSTEEEHDIAHIASSIVARLVRAFFCLRFHNEVSGQHKPACLKTRDGDAARLSDVSSLI
ncbi:hypothetical protein O3W44_04350 [Pantoea sp. LMR881]|uniref:hypothetical protein n=1 Tax=Pantoea sp. LMR881 TaxID=3014336 RepID=UPI0022AF2841|nr:hypothetical protein [Pantoea sp. LMR881]MCZ4058477.1 hypothetical protein [Pantoea sp. LMR881]